jgi:hypothetical protein
MALTRKYQRYRFTFQSKRRPDCLLRPNWIPDSHSFLPTLHEVWFSEKIFKVEDLIEKSDENIFHDVIAIAMIVVLSPLFNDVMQINPQ